ncbi:hypothetical protein C0Q70_02115 [Pomacea canaliculata]|uniref:Endonuclease/exonuclease/phosphatase domain-containing protein n=1 Tax=Pomacea canaliculata TaxID=400727 RepID=A0A2T7Q1E0_POMCA|nr:hypothetical protein C0Q70_02115 [Pomacea canaliculata]
MGMWHSPNRLVHHQIDYILLPRCFKSSINKANMRTYPVAEIGSDHDMVLINLQQKAKQLSDTPPPKFGLIRRSCKKQTLQKFFKDTIGGKFAALNPVECDVGTPTGNIKEMPLSTAQEVLGRQRNNKQPWVTNDILDLSDQKRALKREKESKLKAAYKYKELNCAIKKRDEGR